MRLLTPIMIVCGVLGCLMSLSCADNGTLPSPSMPAAATARASDAHALAGLWRFQVDPASLEAALTPEPIREAADNDDLYLLSANRFFTSGVIRITEVQTSSTTLDINYEITHPFPAPSDPTAPASATNRADLGIAGRLAFLVEVPTATGNTYFSDRVANTSLIVNPDHYYAPAGLLSELLLPANTFPCQTLVDERNGGSRIDIDNGGSPTGNFGTDGWTRAEFGPSNIGWTGYGVLHQGQTSARRISIDLDALSAIGTLDINVALLVRYNDPRGGATSDEKRANRLPPADPDPAQFAYRMSHGALDGAPVAFFSDSGTFEADLASSSTLAFTVVDWDARATETSAANLFDDPDVSKVAVGESGAPTLAICIPGVLGTGATVDLWDASTLTDDDTILGGDLAAESGLPGDELFYSKLVTKAAGSGQSGGTYSGMVRITDPEAALGTPLAVALDAATLAPLTADLPQDVTYQAFKVVQRPGPTGIPGWVATYADTGTDDAYALAVNPDGQTAVAGYSASPTPDASDIFAARYTPAGTQDWSRTYGGSDYHFAEGVAIDAAGNTYITGSFGSPIDFGQGIVTPVGLRDCFVLKLNEAGGSTWLRTFGGATSTARGIGLAIDSIGRLLVAGDVNGTVNFGGAPRTSSGGPDSFILQLSSGGIYQWDRTFSNGLSVDSATAIATGPGDGIVVVGMFNSSLDFGGGIRSSQGDADAYAVRLSQAGVYAWDHIWGGALADTPADAAIDPNTGRIFIGGIAGSAVLGQSHAGGFDGVLFSLTTAGVLTWAQQIGGTGNDGIHGIAVHPNGRLYAAGGFEGTCIGCNGGTPSLGLLDAFVIRTDLAGMPIWQRSFGGTANDLASEIDVDGIGDLRIAGSFNGTCDFDPGPGLLNRTATDQDGFVLRLSGANGYL